MSKEWYKAEIDRVAQANGGNPPGERRFYTETSTRQSGWRNKPWNEWNNWGDVLEEFGYLRGKFIGPTDKAHILRLIAELTQSLNPQRVPTQVDLRRARRKNPAFPSDGAILNRLGRKRELVHALIEFCSDKAEYSQALEIFRAVEAAEQEAESSRQTDEDEPKHGFVYLLRGKDGYKVGMTTAPYSRFSTIIKSLPHGGEPIHHFATDDPRGIEKYWKKRWEPKQIERRNANDGEWFNLNSEDVQGFKRRKKFM
jgi:Meiotically up-regulated gene 113